MKFSYYDSCLLISICMTAGTRSGAGLEAIIAYIDYMDHSIITWKEFLSGLTKLSCIGAIKEKDKKIFLTKKFNTWWLHQYRKTRNISLMNQVEEVTTFLNKTYASIPDQPPGIVLDLTEKDFLAAIKK